MTGGRLRLPILGQPDPDQPRDVHLVGRYAVGVTWADSHSSIYPFDHLRRSDATAPTNADGSLGETMVWPRDIRKLAEGLGVTWADGHQSLYPYPELRVRCRCAVCTGGH